MGLTLLEGLRRLVELQQLDDMLARLGAEAAGFPRRREAAEEARRQAAAAVVGANAALGAAELERRAAEREVADKEALLARLQAQSTQVKTNAAYTALLHEMEAARDAISESETRILEQMDLIDAARADHARAETEVRAVGERTAEEEQSIAAREREVEQELARTREARAKVAEAVEPQLLEQYERLLAQRRPAIAVAAGELCLGCRVGIPPQAYIEAMRGERVVACGSCRRILIHETLVAGRDSEPPA